MNDPFGKTSIYIAVILILWLEAGLILSSCTRSKPPDLAGEAISPPGPVIQVRETPIVTIEGYTFQLNPLIQDKGVTHLNLYIQDAQNHPISKAQAVIDMTPPYGETEQLSLTEDKVAHHYHAQTVMDKKGKYRMIVRVTIRGKTYTPEFSYYQYQQ